MRQRLRRSNPEGPGWTRRRRGSGFSYLDESGRPLPPHAVRRCRDLAIPPAWSDVWICPWPNGHIQATGRDAAGRLQYVYHPLWRRRRDTAKFRRMGDFGASLPAARERVEEHLSAPGMPRERALATAFRMLDLGAIRIGGEAYAKQHGSVGLATLRRDHVEVRGETITLRFAGKSGRKHELELVDQHLADAVRYLLRRQDDSAELLAYRESPRGPWRDVRSGEINDYIRSVMGQDATAKDFRTWNANITLLEQLCASPDPGGSGERAAHVRRAVRAVADKLGNTVSVARASYIDPSLCHRYESQGFDHTETDPEALLQELIAQ